MTNEEITDQINQGMREAAERRALKKMAREELSRSFDLVNRLVGFDETYYLILSMLAAQFGHDEHD